MALSGYAMQTVRDFVGCGLGVSGWIVARLCNRAVLQDIEDRGEGRVLVTLSNTIEIDGEAKPALVAESLALLMRAPRVGTPG